MGVYVELSRKGKPIGQIKISDSGFIFMQDYSRPDLHWQDYNYFNQKCCPIWDKAEALKGGAECEKQD